jgi:hypothetical protein
MMEEINRQIPTAAADIRSSVGDDQARNEAREPPSASSTHQPAEGAPAVDIGTSQVPT